MQQRIRVTLSEGVADVRLTRADKMNALDQAMFDALIETGQSLIRQPGLRAVVLSGEGRAFCAGLDTGRFEKIAAPTDAAGPADVRAANDLRLGPRRFGACNGPQYAAMVWQEVPVPVIAAVHGAALGGGFQIALGADIRFVAPDTKMSVMEIKWGLVPDMAGTVPFSELLPADVLMRLAMTGEQLSGARAAELGLATEASEDPLAAALDLVGQIVERSPDSVAATKRLVYGTRRGSLRSTYRLERRLQARMFKSRNTAIARKAGAAKEPPVFGARTFG